jgi:hypothetical protein
MMRKDLNEAIATAFADVTRPKDEDYTTSPRGDEAYEESQQFWGRDWRTLEPDFLATYRDVLFWFTPQAFHYYLPAFLTIPVATDDETPIYVVTILQLLRAIAKPSFCRERWRMLDDGQVAVLHDWLRWLLTKAPPSGVFHDEITEAIAVIQTRRWWN